MQQLAHCQEGGLHALVPVLRALYVRRVRRRGRRAPFAGLHDMRRCGDSTVRTKARRLPWTARQCVAISATPVMHATSTLACRRSSCARAIVSDVDIAANGDWIVFDRGSDPPSLVKFSRRSRGEARRVELFRSDGSAVRFAPWFARSSTGELWVFDCASLGFVHAQVDA